MKFDPSTNRIYRDQDDFQVQNRALLEAEVGEAAWDDSHYWPHVAQRYDALVDVTMSYDGGFDTLRHIRRVQQLLNLAAIELLRRANVHDDSKFDVKEKFYFDRETPLLAGLTYGSDEYKASLERLGPALQHHYANNSHHPEHFGNGVDGMTLYDVLEMLLGWKAAGERHRDGDIFKSIEINKQRFGLSEQLCQILINTAKTIGQETSPVAWLKPHR
ncbi:DUF5662 family protein [Fibrella aestuarina]|nr:DUF5662 family protein [Fibrella aestuarina]